MTQHHQNPERLDTEKLRGENVKDINSLPKELLGTYGIYLFPPHNEYLDPRGDLILSCTMLDNEKQVSWSLLVIEWPITEATATVATM